MVAGRQAGRHSGRHKARRGACERLLPQIVNTLFCTQREGTEYPYPVTWLDIRQMLHVQPKYTNPPNFTCHAPSNSRSFRIRMLKELRQDKNNSHRVGLELLGESDYCPEVTTANKQKERKSEKEGGREGDAMQHFWLVRPLLPFHFPSLHRALRRLQYGSN